MESLAELMQQYVEVKGLETLEGVIETDISGVWFYRSSKGNARQPFVYQSGIIVFRPLLGISVDVPMVLLQQMVQKLEQRGFQNFCAEKEESCGLKSVKMETSMLNACKRLMRGLCDPLETEVLGQSLLEEVVFRALLSQKGYVLFELAHAEGNYSRIAQVLDKVHQDYSQPLTVQDLASKANMSVSAFHSAFRSVTLESPIQYIKKVRLSKARELIKLEGKRVNDAARLVGYNSTSQFSREYKRHFNETPKSA